MLLEWNSVKDGHQVAAFNASFPDMLSTRFYFACIVRCIGLCHYYQGEHNNSEKSEKREKTKDYNIEKR
jgi:hypothetical protein